MSGSFKSFKGSKGSKGKVFLCNYRVSYTYLTYIYRVSNVYIS